MASIVFLLVLILGAGLIAYAGDLIGRRMGKRRLTIGALRPKHTAIVITTLTGMGIAALTLMLILAADQNLRKTILRGNQIIKQNRDLVASNRDLKLRQDDLQRQADEAKRRSAQAVAEARKAESARAKAEQAEKKAIEAEKSMKERVERIERSLAAETMRLKQAQDQRAKVEALVLKMGREVVKLEAQAVEINRKIGFSRRNYNSLRTGQIIYRDGEEVFRTIIQPVADIAQARRSVMNVLAEAGARANRQGAVKGKTGRSVQLTLPIVKVEGSGQVIKYKESEYIEAIAQRIRDAGRPVAVQLEAEGNTIKGEPVTASVKVIPVRLAFAKGETLACEWINPFSASADVSSQIRNFLSGPVRERAANAGVVGRSKGYGEQSYFEVDVDTIAALVSKIEERGERVRVCARASADTTTAGPLKLVFALEK